MSFLREPNVSAPDPLHAPETGPAPFLLPAWHAPAPVHAPSSLVPFLIYQSHPLKYPQGWAAGLLYSLLSSSFAFLVTRRLPPGLPRFLACAPWLACNALLPWVFDPATHGVGVAVLFCIVTWLHSFKLLALCWNRGILVRPLVRDNSLLFFAALSFPIHISLREGKRGKGKEVGEERGGVASPPPVPSDAVGAKKEPSPHAAKPWEAESWSELLVQSAVKTVLLTLLMRVYFWHDSLPSIAVHALHTLCLFLFVTVVCEMLAGVTGVVADHIEFEPHFRHPYFADSFADFWARRWNLTVSALLRDCVYDPILDALLPAAPPPTQGPTAARLGQIGNAGPKATSGDGDGDAVVRRTPSPPSGLGWAQTMMATFLHTRLP